MFLSKPICGLKAYLLTILILLTVLISLAVSTISLADPDELLLNGGFEEGTDPWQAYSGTLARTTAPNFVRNGSFAANFSTTMLEPNIRQVIQVQPGATYNFSGWVIMNDENIANIFLRISFVGSPQYYDSILLAGTCNKYRNLSVSASAPLGVSSAKLEAVLLLFGTSSAVAYFDDMSFIEVSPPPPTPTPTPTPTVPPTTTPTPTPTHTLTPTPTPTPIPMPISTPTPTPTKYPTYSPTLMPTSTPTPTPSTSPTLSSTPTPTPSPTTTGTTANIGDVLINEVQYDPSQSGTDAPFEWIELFNCTTETIELEGWRIGDNYGSDPIPSLTLPSHGFAVIAATQDFHTNFPDFTGTTVFIKDSKIGNGLGNDGDRLILKDSASTIIDALSYGDNDTIMLPPCQDVAAGHSLERQPAGLDTDQASDFVDNPNPTPGYGLATIVPTPTLTITPTPTPTAVPTVTPTVTATATPTSTPPSSPTPEGTTPPPQESPTRSGTVLRAILITVAIALFAIASWFEVRRRRK